MVACSHSSHLNRYEAYTTVFGSLRKILRYKLSNNNELRLSLFGQMPKFFDLTFARHLRPSY